MTPTELVRRLAAAALGVAAAFAWAAPARAEDEDDPNEVCIVCHEEAGLQGERGGKKISVHVDPAKFRASVHAKVPCVDCHEDLEDVTGPHKADADPVDCAKCHDKEGAAHAASLHGQAHAKGDPMAPTCADCHTAHEVKRPADPTSPTYHMNIPLLCGKCHHEGSPVSRTHDIPQDRILENYSEGMHGEGLFKKGLAVTAVCTSCHTSHEIRPHTDPKSSIAPANIVKTCTQCHVQIERVHRKVIDGKLWESEPNRIPVCADCHQPHKVRRVFYPAGAANKDCLTCHGKPDLTMQKDGRTVSLFVDEAKYAKSTHANTGCAQCHSDVDPSHQRACDTVKKKVDCSACHADQAREYGESKHGELHAKGDRDAPFCLDCHDKHATQSRKWPESPTFPRNVPTLCAGCHGKDQRAGIRIKADVPDIVGAYMESVHGKGLRESGLVVTATCVSCHTAHRELPPDDPRSSVNRAHLATTCGKCHQGVAEQLALSIHAKPVDGPDGKPKELPTCEDCHTSHTIGRADGSFRVKVVEQCGKCHAEQAETFHETFHGKATSLGGSVPAKCQDCHGRHDILPPEDPKSHANAANLVQTCGKCHAGAHESFTAYMPHASHNDPDEPSLYWSFRLMTGLLVGTMIIAFLHTILWLVRLWTTRAEWGPHRAAVLASVKRGDAKFYRRFTPTQSTMHFVMVASFLTLALTGMALKFSWANWGQRISAFLGGYDRMGMLHRTAAVLLLGLFVFHIWHLTRMRRIWGWSWKDLCFGPDSMMFGGRDWTEFKGTLAWFVGRGPRPSYGRFTYWEKFDYFAVFWGVAVIGASGLVLWFPVAATHVLPGWAINVATIIHGDEALLAVAFIFTIHFFNTQFRPDKFPLDVSVFTGVVPLDELKEERPREYEQLVASGDMDRHLAPAPPSHFERGVKFLGVVALVLGLALVAAIGYAMFRGHG